jgi:hypothetical protein
MLFAYRLWGVSWIGILTNIPLSIVVMLALVALNWRLIGLTQRGEGRPNYAERSGKERLPIPAWLIYLVTSILLLFIGTLLAAR